MARKDEELKVIENTELTSGYYKLKLKSPRLAQDSKPGQFCMLKVHSAFLRRPLSVSGAGACSIEFIYKVIGRGTKFLEGLTKGSAISVLGPLGSGYECALLKNTVPLLVCGGTGIASLSFLASRLKTKGILFYGARKKSDIVLPKAFNGWQKYISTEDGSFGARGYVTASLDEFLKLNKKKNVIYACGPTAMMEKVARIAALHGVKGFASMEEMMACGVGNCQGCAVRINGKNKMACNDGPVFKLDEIEWQ